MAFGKKKQTGSDESVGAPVQQAPMKAKKKNEMLSSVLSESVVEKLLDEFKECEFFKGEFNGETAYLGLMLAVDDIGGLSKKTNRDEDKGAIVEQIKSGRMQVLITPALLNDERMVFVPSLPTVDAMGEFGILVNAPYTLVWVTPTGDIAVTDKTVSFADIAAVYENDENAYDKFFGTGTVVNQPTFTREFDTEEPDYAGSDDDEIEEVSEEEFDEDEADASDVAEEPAYEADSVDESMDESDYESDDYSEYETEMEQTDDSNAEYDDDDYAQNGVADGDDEYYYEDDDDAEYSDESVDSTITRLFFSDDLALEVTSEPFDQQFMSQDTFVPFEENRGDGWLNGYLSQMAMNANTDLEKTHSTNMQMLRERYFRLVASYIEVIGKKLDYRNPDTKYGMAYANLVAQKAQLLNDAPAKTEQRVAECEKKWQEKLDEVGRNAATAAKAQYTERFQDMHDRDLRVIRTSVEDEINNGYQDAFRKMQTDRKADAQDLLNFSINAALTEIGDMYDKFAKAEQSKYNHYRDEMNRFLDANRKDEVSRIKALEEELAHNNKIEQTNKEADARIEAVRAECNDRVAALRSQMADLNDKHAADMRSVESRHNERADLLKDQIHNLQDKNSQLVDTISTMDENKSKEYASRMNALEQRCKTAEEEQERLIAVHKRSNVISVVLFVVACVAVMAIGVIVGFFWHMNSDNHNDEIKNNVTAAAVQTQNPYAGTVVEEVPTTQAVTEAPKAETQSATANEKANEKTSTEQVEETTAESGSGASE